MSVHCRRHHHQVAKRLPKKRTLIVISKNWPAFCVLPDSIRGRGDFNALTKYCQVKMYKAAVFIEVVILSINDISIICLFLSINSGVFYRCACECGLLRQLRDHPTGSYTRRRRSLPIGHRQNPLRRRNGRNIQLDGGDSARRAQK